MHKAIFLDRDGVIIENVPTYVRSWSDVRVYAQALGALVSVASSAFKIVIITNQSVIGRGLISLEAAESINQRLVHEIQAAGGRIDAVYMCPHAPEDNCACRKPLPGLLLQAARELQIDLENSILIGDAISDLQSGQAARIKTLAIVRSGRGAEQLRLSNPGVPPGSRTYENLAEALSDLVWQDR